LKDNVKHSKSCWYQIMFKWK